MSLLSSPVPAKPWAARALVLLALSAAACGEPSGPAPKPTSIVLTSAQPTTGTAGLAMPNAITFEVKDQNGATMANIPVTVTASSGGSVTGAPTATAATGSTPVGTWTLAPTAGTNTLTIAVEGVSPLAINVQGLAGAAAKFVVLSAEQDTGTVGATSPLLPKVSVRDQFDNFVAGATATVTASNGSTSPATVTANANGEIAITAWTLGTVVGNNTLTITSGSATKSFVVLGTAGPAAALGVISGNNQTGLAGRALAQPVAFSVTDQYGNPVPGGSVTVTVAGGGSASQIVTNAQGLATTTWTLGKSVVPQTLTAKSGSYTATANATVSTGYKVEVRFVGPAMSTSVQNAFTAAAARLMAMITGDLQNVTTGGQLDLAESCGNPDLPTVDEIVDDIVIYASAPALDGPGGLLGQAGPCLIRQSGSQLPVYGTMEFDSADLARMEADGTLTSVILHEMMHVVGIGVYWEFAGLLQDVDLSTVRFAGALATEQCRLEGGTNICNGSVPVEDGGGDGTKNSHWRESIFDTEIMTGWENSPIVNGVALPAPISRMTVGSLQDIGYEANLDAGDTYRIPGTGLRATAGGSTTLRKWEGTIRQPRGRIDPSSGRVTPIAPR